MLSGCFCISRFVSYTDFGSWCVEFRSSSFGRFRNLLFFVLNGKAKEDNLFRLTALKKWLLNRPTLFKLRTNRSVLNFPELMSIVSIRSLVNWFTLFLIAALIFSAGYYSAPIFFTIQELDCIVALYFLQFK